ncbi:PREDICTED: UDP-glycosyltransferase 92A1 [Brassica oleracea var. oleracea]|uniref:Glycosyltransferase n=1 Tax=Brassica oleracea var. oleracea TaxID=109376 RepID=A0A0D3EFX8_BRAOL|nr:PREDICTED: UDP-glycosyltransferase 92A1 [Brassica oleracea var. oleracea]
MEMADAKPKSLNIVMFPFMAQGHIIPFVSLALRLEKMIKNKNREDNLILSLVNTPLNMPKLRSKLPPDSSIKLIELPFNSSDHGLPHDAENFDSLPYSLVISLLEASRSLREPFRDLITRILKEGDDVVVIGDFFLGWIGEVCKEVGVSSFIFSASGAFGLGCYRSIWLHLPHKETEQDQFLLHDFQEAGEIEKTQLNYFMLEADGTDDWSVFMKKNLPGWSDFDGFLFNTVEEIDHIGLSYFRKITGGKPVWPVGPVLPDAGSRSTEEGVKAWLDSKPDHSVVYVCFGSMNSISQTHMLELAMALESSEKNFIWVVRPPMGVEANKDFDVKEYLPEGFEERIKKSRRGVIVKKWAPQVDILSHKGTCVFLSHCGWNSILESLSYGVPLLGWPMAGEQFFNSILMEKHVGVSVELARGKRCDIKCDEIVSKIKLVMEESEVGREVRRKAKEVKELVRRAMDDGVNGSSVIGLEEFISHATVKNEKS